YNHGKIQANRRHVRLRPALVETALAPRALLEQEELSVARRKLLVDRQKLADRRKLLVDGKGCRQIGGAAGGSAKAADRRELLVARRKLLVDRQRLQADRRELLVARRKLLVDRQRLQADRRELLVARRKLLVDRQRLQADRRELLVARRKLLADRQRLQADRRELLVARRKLLVDRQRLQADRRELLVLLAGKGCRQIGGSCWWLGESCWWIGKGCRQIGGAAEKKLLENRLIRKLACANLTSTIERLRLYNKMKVVGLVSGGKDSCYNMIECVRSGHQIVALAHLYPPSGAEMDSFMYQTVGSEAVALYAKATGLPLYTRPIVGESRDTGSADHYASSSNSGDSEDEVEDLYKLLAEVKAGIPGLQAVSVGAILSNYQRVRVESVCERLDLQVLAFLWRRDQTELLDEMLFSGLDAILIKVAAYGLSPKRHLGRRLVDIRDELVRLAAPAAGGLSPCGEGGEYETLALDCPLFKHGRIVLDNGHLTAAGTDSRVVVHSDDAFAPVCYLKLTGCCRLGEPKAGLEEFSAKQPSSIDRISPAVIEREFQIDAKNYPNSRGGSLYCDDDSNDLPSLRLSVINVQVAEQSGEISVAEMAKLLMSKANAAIQAAGGEQSAEMRPLLCVLTVPDMSSFALVNYVYGSPELGFASRRAIDRRQRELALNWQQQRLK
uniref:Diphthine--ammonia ligase n=1 Tax=Macrostomum lignano TaxID=282301 RepID=A0A1I8FTD7_9PLAT